LAVCPNQPPAKPRVKITIALSNKPIIWFLFMPVCIAPVLIGRNWPGSSDRADGCSSSARSKSLNNWMTSYARKANGAGTPSKPLKPLTWGASLPGSLLAGAACFNEVLSKGTIFSSALYPKLWRARKSRDTKRPRKADKNTAFTHSVPAGLACAEKKDAGEPSSGQECSHSPNLDRRAVQAMTDCSPAHRF
jgi:hypothetical protein